MIPGDFHFLRPEWLWLIPLLVILLIFIVKNFRYKNHWNNVCDAPLLQYQLMQGQQNTSKWQWLRSFSFFLLFFSLLLIAMAGPSWEKKEQPIFQQDDALVIILDLSLSMNASDVKPSRLERAKLKLIDILKQKKEGQTGLIAFAGDAHTVSPLTIDNKTIISLLPALEISIMPLLGSHMKDALIGAKDLLMNAGFMQGDILLITDGIDSAHQKSITQQVKQLRQQGYQLSIIGIGSRAGSPIPIPNSGGFIKDKLGQVILSKLNAGSLKTLAHEGGGQYHKLSLDDGDFQSLLERKLNNNTIEQDNQIQQWVDAGGYVILLILPLVLLLFRRGLLSLSFLILLSPLIYNQPVQAQTQNIEAEESKTFKQKAYQFIKSDQWNNLWMTEDQRGQKDFNKKNYNQAAEKFNNPQWKAGAHYRAREFDKAIEQYEQFDDAESLYNKANALANMQKYEQAIESYDQALEKTSDLPDVVKNRDYVKKLLEQQKQQHEQQKSNQSSPDDQQQENKEQQESDSENQQQQESNDEIQQTDSKSNKPEQEDKQDNNASEQSNQENNSDQEQSQQDKAEKEFQQYAQEPKEQDFPPSEQEAQETDSQEGENSTEDVLSQLSQEEQQSLKQWLQRIPDNPGELLRVKFRNNSMNKQRQQNAPQQYKGDPW